MKRASLTALAALALGCAPQPAPPSPPASPVTAFVDVTVLPLDADRRLPHHTVLVREGRIVALAPAASLKVPEGARVIDGRGKFLLPGLADMHVHLTRESDLGLYLAEGVTTVRNMWGAPIHLEMRARIARGELDGPSIHTAGPIVDGEEPVHDGSLAVRDAADAERAVTLHREAGYDFVKVYSRISPAAYARLAERTRAAGMKLAGHVPRAVGLVGAVDAGLGVVEHLSFFAEALQAEGSPVAGKFDDASQDRKIDFVDEARLPALVRKLRERGVWVCPTRNLAAQSAPAAEIRARLARPEIKYVPGFEQAMWAPREDGPPEELARAAREAAFADRVIAALHRGGVRLVTGTDTGNPLVIPGFTLHEELRLLVRAGLSPYAALRAATADASALLGTASEVGVVATGRRADLLLVDADPLLDVAASERIAGVMARGRWYGPAERAALLQKVEDHAARRVDPFASVPPLAAEGAREFAATFEVSWRGVPFDTERMVVTRAASGERTVHAQTIDPHRGQWMTVHLFAGASGLGDRLGLASDGAAGRGRIEVLRDAGRARGSGVLLSGMPAALDAELPEGALLGADHLLAPKLLLAPRLAGLEVGASLELREAEVALGSSAGAKLRALTVTRAPDEGAARRFQITVAGRRPKTEVLWLDARGFPLAFEIQAWGGIRYTRR
jgi:imidazolonepropionase-like amidohydrolase